MTQDGSRSPFAVMLEKLLDKTDLFDRAGWARVLALSPEDISLWTEDKAIPTVEKLIGVLDILHASHNTPMKILNEFDAMSLQPFRDVSPHADTNIYQVSIGVSLTIADYLLRSLFESFAGMWSTLPPRLKEQVMHEALAHCRKLHRQMIRQ